tara:strand:- start:3975 stop:4904 length:930 start_codon:yes stop_codon:yes gene_type:complete
MEIEKLNKSVYRVNITMPSVTVKAEPGTPRQAGLPCGRKSRGWEKWFLLQADHHWDNPKTNRDLMSLHLDQAMERDAGILMFGDFYCLMQGKGDPRMAKGDIRPEHKNNRYIDSVVETSIEYLEPYAKNIMHIGMGNHEYSILQHKETDVIQRLLALLNAEHGLSIQGGNYSGWIIFQFRFEKSKKVFSKKLYFTHGSGGGGPVTKGVIQSNRKAVYLPDAHMVVQGHIHEQWIVEICRDRCNSRGTTYMDYQTHIQLPTYKDEYTDEPNSWHRRKGRPPKPLGAYWLRFFWNHLLGEVDYQVIPASRG